MMDNNNGNYEYSGFSVNNTYGYNMEPVPPYSEPPKRKKSSGKLKLLSAALAVSLFSGAAGGGVVYYAMGNAQLTAQVMEEAQTTVAPTSALTTADTGYATSNIAEIVAKASPSVVEITVESTVFSPFFGEMSSGGSGSGVIVTEDGYIVTNDHVVENGDTIKVRTTDGEEYDGILIGTDEQTDLAVIKIEASGLAAATFADSDQIAVGDLAVAIGNSLGTLGGTVTDGIISAKDREISIEGKSMTLLQTSAAVNPGNSGGGLFDANGNLVGVVNAKSSGSEVEGLGFAIPSNLVREVVDDMMANGYVTGRVELGISIVEVADQQTAAQFRVAELGVYVAQSTKENGLRAGDRFVSVNGKAIEQSSDLTELIQKCAVGDELDVVVVRQGEQISVTVPVSEQVPDYIQERIRQGASI